MLEKASVEKSQAGSSETLSRASEVSSPDSWKVDRAKGKTLDEISAIAHSS